MKLNLFRFINSIPVIPITTHTGGQSGSYASMNGLSALVQGIVVMGLIVYFWFKGWYQRHPVWGKIIVIVLVLWGIWQLVRLIRALCDDPYTRTQPYRKIDLEENPLTQDLAENTKGAEPKKDKTRS